MVRESERHEIKITAHLIPWRTVFKAFTRGDLIVDIPRKGTEIIFKRKIMKNNWYEKSETD